MVRSPVTQSFISRYAPEHARGQYMGADSLQFTIGRFLAPVTVFLSTYGYIQHYLAIGINQCGAVYPAISNV